MYAEEIICHNTIYLSSPKHFNDPFDSSADLVAIPKESEAKAIYDLLDEKERKKLNEDKSPQKNGYPYYAHLFAMIKEVDDALSLNGICCFSDIKTNILLWSHYANLHRGICIEFKPDYSKYPFCNIKRVTYTENKPSLNYRKKNYVDLLSIKFKNWEYESEYRIIVPKSNDVSVEIDPKEITRVIVGYKANETDKLRIENWVKRSKSRISLLEAVKAPQKYELQTRRYNHIKLMLGNDILKAATELSEKSRRKIQISPQTQHTVP